MLLLYKISIRISALPFHSNKKCSCYCSLLHNSLDWNRFYGEELYDHTIDPDEYINLYDRHEFAAIKLQLKHLLRTKLDN